MDETKAIQMCLIEKDSRGFEYLFLKYQRQAYFHGLSFTGNEQDAQEACQEAFAKAFLAMPRLRALNHFYPWFYTILRNHSFNLVKRRHTGEMIKRKLKPSEIDPSPKPDAILEGSEEKKMIWSVYQQLKPEFREILTMKHMEDLSYQVISSILEIPRGTVMSRLFHARHAFRKEYLRTVESLERRST